jgi:hypothetical protein
MKIGKNMVLELGDGSKFWLVNAKKIGEADYCLISSMTAPVEMRVASMRLRDGQAEIALYDGADYNEIFARLAEVK